MENIIDSFKTQFSNQFPNSVIYVRKATLSDDMVINFTLAQPDDWSFNIMHNDPMHHIFILSKHQKGFQIEKISGGLYVEPREPYMAMTCIKTGFKKKTGTNEQIIKHCQKWINELKSLVIENQHDIYGGFEKYQKYI